MTEQWLQAFLEQLDGRLARIEGRQETHGKRLENIEGRMNRWAGGLAVIGAAAGAAAATLAGWLKSHVT